jgi:hypothetical protein
MEEQLPAEFSQYSDPNYAAQLMAETLSSTAPAEEAQTPKKGPASDKTATTEAPAAENS